MAAMWTLARLERAVETFSAQLQCAICLCAYENPVSLPCNHCFCEECIHRALELKTLCPICKTPANKRRLRYDTTLRELLRAMEMLSATPEKVVQAETPKADGEEKELPRRAAAQVAGTPPPPPRRSTRNLTAGSSLLTNKRVTGKYLPLCSQLEVNEESAARGGALAERRSSPRRALLQDVQSPTTDGLLSDVKSGNRAKPRRVDARACKLTKEDTVETLTLQPPVDADDGSAVDVVVAETQLDDVEKQLRMTRRRRQMCTQLDAVQDDDNTQRVPSTRLRSAANPVAVANTRSNKTLLRTSTSRKRRRTTVSGAAPDIAAGIALRRTAVSSRPLPPRSGSVRVSPLAVDCQPPIRSAEGKALFQVGDLVDVIERQWVGINKRSGAARITKVCGDGFYAVKFVMGCRDNRVPESCIRRPAKELMSETTPSYVVKQRQRRRVSDTSTPPHSAAKTKVSDDTPKVTAKRKTKQTAKQKHSTMVFLCSGFEKCRMQQIKKWADQLKAEVVQCWTHDVTHLIVKCVDGDDAEEGDSSIDDFETSSSGRKHRHEKHRRFTGSKSGRWVKTRSLKYLKALVAGRWIVSDEWLQACAEHGSYVSEAKYEVDGHWKGRGSQDAAKRSRLIREKLLQLSSPDIDRSTVGTTLFADFCFYIVGEFLPPIPPVAELNTLITMGNGKLITSMDDIRDEMHKRENRTRKLIIVSDKINPTALRQQTRYLKALSQVKAVRSVIVVNYLWVVNSISEASLRGLPVL